MREFKEFEGKSIDDAILAACEFYDAQRDKLEIEIVSESKGGIFGLVGARKAQIKARMRDNLFEHRNVIEDTLNRILDPIIGQPEMEILFDEPGKAKVIISSDEENSGLLIGREGQTLAAIQYIANRILAKKLPEPLKLQIDTGDYRERQEDNLKQLALHLADKVKTQGRPQSTKPLSSYHRRVVHMALQGDGDIQTRSKGDGPLKRVLILPKRGPSRGPRTPRPQAED